MTELLERLNRELAGSYRLTGELGAGGMATVFAAQDLRHDRRVAVKVLTQLESIDIPPPTRPSIAIMPFTSPGDDPDGQAIAVRVITELDVKLTMGEQARVWRKCLTHPDGRRHYYRGLNHFFQSTRDSVAAARSEFERVARLVPSSPVGAAWTALSLWLQATRGWDAKASNLAIDWGERATALPDADGQAHTVLASALVRGGWSAKARHALRDLPQLEPEFNLDRCLANQPFRSSVVIDRLRSELRQAGLH